MVTAARKQRRRDRWYKRKEQYRQERKYRYRQARSRNDPLDPDEPRLEAALSPLLATGSTSYERASTCSGTGPASAKPGS